MGWDEGRFYSIDGRDYPSVTTILSVINKPALGPWYAKMERTAMETAILEVAMSAEKAGHKAIATGTLLDAVGLALKGVKAADKVKTAAADVGTAAHALVEWHTRVMLGEDAGPEPQVPDAALLAVESWKDWCKEVDFKPLWVERVVYHPGDGYAGTADWKGYVKGVCTLGDIKTGKAIYPEAYLQNRAYRSANEWMIAQTWKDRTQEMEPIAEQGIILRLPKTLEDPTFEAQFVPETSLEDFLACKRLWEWQRRAEGKPTDRKSNKGGK